MASQVYIVQCSCGKVGKLIYDSVQSKWKPSQGWKWSAQAGHHCTRGHNQAGEAEPEENNPQKRNLQ